MNNSSLTSFNNKYLTLKGLSTKQKDALIAGGLTLGAVITGVGFYELFGSSNVVSPISSTDESSVPYDEEAPVEVDAVEATTLVDDSEMTDTANEITEVTFSFHSDVNISLAVSDDMNFEDAFSAAREDVGVGGFFNYKGESYSTFYKEEWEGMSSVNQNEFLSEVEEKSDVTNFVEYESIENQSIGIDSRVEDFEIIEDTTLDLAKDAEVGNDVFEEDDFFEGLEADVVDAPAADSNSMESDDFFDSLTSESESENSPAQEEELMAVPSIEEDDFFAELEDENEEEIDISNDENVVIVRPVYGMDEDSDGVVDMVAIDANEDGIADVVAIDEDKDGDFESFLVNQDGGENLDVFIIDEGNDGIDSGDTTESIDDIVTMEDFIVLDENELESIEDLELIESLIDGTEIIIDDEVSEELEDNDFDEIGL